MAPLVASQLVAPHSSPPPRCTPFPTLRHPKVILGPVTFELAGSRHNIQSLRPRNSYDFRGPPRTS